MMSNYRSDDFNAYDPETCRGCQDAAAAIEKLEADLRDARADRAALLNLLRRCETDIRAWLTEEYDAYLAEPDEPPGVAVTRALLADLRAALAKEGK